MSPEPVVACVGDSALWCTGTRYEDKTPNVAHRILTGSSNSKPDGDPIPPAQFRARGGAIIGVDHPYRITSVSGWQTELSNKRSDCESEIASDGFSADACKIDIAPNAAIQLNRNAKYLDDGGDVYGFIKDGADPLEDHYSVDDRNDVNELAWTIARDIGWHWPRIVDQIEQFPPRGTAKPDLDVPGDGTRDIDQFGGPVDTEPPYAEDVDLLLINGGTNDIELGWLNNPAIGATAEARRSRILDAVKKHCYRDQKTLLERARRRFPNAIILLVGYYPYASDWTWRAKAKEFLSAQAGLAGAVNAVVERATDNALNFARAQSYWMRRAVSEVARADDGPGTVFVARGFGVVNAFDAPEPWSWGVPADRTDDTGDDRRGACMAKHDGTEPACVQASIGHPNTAGSERTARAIVDRYEGYTRLATREPTAGWTDDRPISLRDACENYDLDPGGDGLRYCLSHRVVDSLRVDVETGGEAGGGTGPADRKNDVYLEIEPGRNGNRERFRLETEANDFRSNSTDRFFIDPMMGRQTSADVGPVQEEKTVGSVGIDEGTEAYQDHIDDGDPGHGPEHLTETDHPSLPYHRGQRWDSKRLRLGDIERISLIVEDSDPWALDGVSVAINGFIEFSRSIGGVDGNAVFVIWGR